MCVRFTFAKEDATLDAAHDNLQVLKSKLIAFGAHQGGLPSSSRPTTTSASILTSKPSKGVQFQVVAESDDVRKGLALKPVQGNDGNMTSSSSGSSDSSSSTTSKASRVDLRSSKKRVQRSMNRSRAMSITIIGIGIVLLWKRGFSRGGRY